MNDTARQAVPLSDKTDVERKGDEKPKPAVAVAPAPEPKAKESTRKKGSGLLARSFLLVVVLPTIATGVYYGLFASDIYVSEARFAVRTGDDAPAAGLLTALVGVSGGGHSSDDTQIVRDYILSRDMLVALEKRMHLREHFSDPSIDWWARLKPDATMEEYLEYYRNMVDVTTDVTSDITVLQARTFDPALSKQLAANLIELSEDLVNQLSERITEDTLRFARHELGVAEDRVRGAKQAVTDFRNESRSIDPGEETSAVMSIVTKLESELAATRAALGEAESVMRSDSTKVKTLKNRIRALEEQAKIERDRLANNESASDLSQLIDDYEMLALEQKLAEQHYASALASLEVARAEAQRKQRYLIAFVAPVQPDEALEPERVKSTVAVFFGLLLTFVIGALTVSAIQDHANL